MAIDNTERLVAYLTATINSVFKILPLYEEGNEGIGLYVDSLLFELYGLDTVFDVKNHEYVSLLSTLESVKDELAKPEDRKPVVKREVFKCISLLKGLSSKLEAGG